MRNKLKKLKNDNRGVAALLTIVIIGAAVLIMAASASQLGLGELESGYYSQKGEEAFSVADGCAEEAMRRLRMDANYAGGSLNLGAGSCIISVVVAGSSRTVDVVGTVGEYNKKIEVSLTLNGNVITIDNWSEVSF